MSTRVDMEGKIALEPDVRRRLGIKTGWKARQVVVGDHIEVHFSHPHGEDSAANRTPSLRGAAKPFMRASRPSRNWDATVGDSMARDF